MRTAALSLVLAVGGLAAPSGCTPSPADVPLDRPDTLASADTTSDTPGAYRVLAASEAAAVGQQCSRTSPVVEGGWTMTEADAQVVERRLLDLLRLPPARFPAGARVDLAASYRQYVGVVVGGRRVVYVNARPLQGLEAYAEADLARAFVVCDGGAGFWGAVFDPSTDTFSDLAFNGPG